MSELDI